MEIGNMAIEGLEELEKLTDAEVKVLIREFYKLSDDASDSSNLGEEEYKRCHAKLNDFCLNHPYMRPAFKINYKGFFYKSFFQKETSTW